MVSLIGISVRGALSLTLLAAVAFGHDLSGTSALTKEQHGSLSHYPSLFRTSWNAVKDRRQGVNSTVESSNYEKWYDGVPFSYPAPSGKEVVVCLVQKAGSSRWKLLLSLATEGREAINTHCVHCTKPSWIPTSHEQHINDVSNDSAIRMMWIRNPYSRILSAFLDKMHEPHGQQAKRWKRIVKYHGGPYESTPEGFERFVERLLYMRDNNIEVNPHFTPMAEHCGIDKGMQYDLYLQVEKINEWYAEVIDLLGLSEFVKSGWSSLQTPGVPDCFNQMPGMSCEETDMYLQAVASNMTSELDTPATLEDAGAGWMESGNTAHAHGADRLLLQYYNSQKIVDMVTDYLSADILTFGYDKLELYHS